VPTTQINVERMPWTTEPGPGGLKTLWSIATAEVTSAASWLRRLRCGVGGHAMMMRFEPGRLSLHCHECGEQTPGWAIGTGN